MKGLMVLFLLFFTTVATCYSLTRWEKPYEIGNQLSCLLDYWKFRRNRATIPAT